jgi:hypothetical protein
MVPFGDGMKDEDHGESCDPLSPEREPEPWLDGPDESAHFTLLNNFFTLGVSVSVSRMDGRKQKVV